MKCDVCNNDLKKVNLYQNVYCHFEFRNIYKNQKIFYYECENCKLIYNKSFFFNKIFKEKRYILSNQTKEKFIKYKNIKKSRAEIQSHKFYKFIQNIKKPSILDIGSFDGLLLKEFKKKLENKRNYNLVGYDVNKSLKNNYDKSIFFTTSFKSLKRYKYDLIVLSHSIMYINELYKLLILIKQNLKKEGTLIIQLSSLMVRPMNILLADQYIFPSEFALTNLFKKIKLYPRELNSKFFENEKIFIFNKKFKNISKSYNHYSLNSLIETNKKQIINFVKRLKHLRKFYIFGTTLEASIVYDILLDNKKLVFGFVDQSNSKFIFRNIKVYDPTLIKTNTYIVFPYNNKQLLDNLKNKYKLKFISFYESLANY